MLWHRELTPEDVATARRIAPMHRPDNRGRCYSATHLIHAPDYPCYPAWWAKTVLEEAARGLVPGERRTA